MASVMIGLALFLTTGGHLAILQGVAWTNMVRDFAKTESIGTALEKTFDGQHPCTLCKKITESGSGKKDDALTSAKSKLGEYLPQSHSLLAPVAPIVRLDFPEIHFPAGINLTTVSA
jgi:hypothetical protein